MPVILVLRGVMIPMFTALSALVGLGWHNIFNYQPVHAQAAVRAEQVATHKHKKTQAAAKSGHKKKKVGRKVKQRKKKRYKYAPKKKRRYSKKKVAKRSYKKSRKVVKKVKKRYLKKKLAKKVVKKKATKKWRYKKAKKKVSRKNWYHKSGTKHAKKKPKVAKKAVGKKRPTKKKAKSVVKRQQPKKKTPAKKKRHVVPTKPDTKKTDQHQKQPAKAKVKPKPASKPAVKPVPTPVVPDKKPEVKPQPKPKVISLFNASSAPLRLQNGGQVSDNTVHSVYNHTVVGYNFDYKVGTESTGYNVPKEFIKYAKEMYPLWLNESTVPSAGDDRAMIAGYLDRYIDEHPEVREQSFHFVANQKDVNRYVDVYNLSDHDRMELSSFLVQLNNNIRHQFGLDGYHTTHAMDQIADRIGIEYDRDNWTWGPNRRHDFAGINRLAEYFGFVQGNDYDTQYLENNVYFTYLTPQYLSHISMADLKANIYMCFGDMWFGDGGGDTEYSHVCSLLGSDKNTSMAVAFDHQGFMHFVSSDFYNIVSDNTKQDLLNSQYAFTDY